MSEYTPGRAQRATTSITATVTAGKRAADFKILNVSVSGAKLQGPLALKLHEKIEIRFVTDGRSVTLVAEVVRVDSPDLMTDQIAAKFVDLSPDAGDILQHVVNAALEAEKAARTAEIPVIKGDAAADAPKTVLEPDE